MILSSAYVNGFIVKYPINFKKFTGATHPLCGTVADAIGGESVAGMGWGAKRWVGIQLKVEVINNIIQVISR
jgi:hypothetical protein